MAMRAANTGMIIVGGGLVKHHICNANLMVSIKEIRIFFLLSHVSTFYAPKTTQNLNA